MLLVILAIILAVLSLIWPNPYLVGVAVILTDAALLIGRA